MIRRFLFDTLAPTVIDLIDAPLDAELAARNRIRIDAAKRALGDKYILAKPFKSHKGPIDWLNRKEQA